jgi:hypothetical protein
MVVALDLTVCFISLFLGGYLPLFLTGGMGRHVQPSPVTVNRRRKRP